MSLSTAVVGIGAINLEKALNPPIVFGGILSLLRGGWAEADLRSQITFFRHDHTVFVLLTLSAIFLIGSDRQAHSVPHSLTTYSSVQDKI